MLGWRTVMAGWTDVVVVEPDPDALLADPVAVEEEANIVDQP
jgi:hypothetical protein